MFKRSIFLFLILTAVLSARAAEEETEPTGLIPAALLKELNVSAVFEYVCRPNYRCEVKCSAGEGQENFARQNVHRLELAPQENLYLVAAVYTDAVGKAHESMALLPRPASCVIDNMSLKAATPLVEGHLARPLDEGEVIFDMQPEG